MTGQASFRQQHGFTLVELAMVLFVISLVIGGLLVPLASQLEARQRGEAQARLEEIREALIGYAVINGRLPCHTTEADPGAAAYGEADVVCTPASLTTDGILPWKTLGLMSGTDPWGAPRTTSTDSWNGYWRYRVKTGFVSEFTLTTDPNVAPAIYISMLNTGASSFASTVFTALTASTEQPIALVYSTGANLVADGRNADYEAATSALYEGGNVSNLDRDGDGEEDEFDDVMIWITRPILFSRMVSAGTLP